MGVSALPLCTVCTTEIPKRVNKKSHRGIISQHAFKDQQKTKLSMEAPLLVNDELHLMGEGGNLRDAWKLLRAELEFDGR